MFTIPQRLALAVQHHEAGRRDEAEAIYREILLESPHNPHALHLLGVLAHQAGNYAEAIDLIGQALTVHGPHAVFHSNLASACLAAGNVDEAEMHCREALRLKPELADAHQNFSAVLLRRGQGEEAEQAMRTARRLRARAAVASRPTTPLAQALDQLQDTVRTDPGNAAARHDLGIVLMASGQTALAVEHLREAVRLRPDSADARADLGAALSYLSQMDEAMHCFRRALQIDPAHKRARNNLASSLEYLGRTDEAIKQLHQVLAVDPADSQALFALSELAVSGFYQFSEDEMGRVNALVARSDLPIDDACRLRFALAQLLDKAGAYDQAFDHCRKANAARQALNRRMGICYDPESHRELVDRLIAWFTPAYFERVQSFGVPSELPVFVVGMMRSGTTLVEQILASHPQVHGAGELQEMTNLVGALPGRLGAARYPECVERLDASKARVLAEQHLHMLRQRGGTATRLVDKNPLNFLHLGVIATLFPKAQIIHCRRDPLDTCISCYFRNFADPFPFKLDLRHLGHYYREYERLMAHWSRVLPMPVFDLKYEELVAEQEAVSRQLVAHCGLEWDERCLRFHETGRPVRTASALQVRRPISKSAIGRWKRYEKHLGPLFETLRG